jgi:hypothetical protein
VRIHDRAADWLVRTDAAPDVSRLFKCAHVALPSRAPGQFSVWDGRAPRKANRSL